MPEVHRRAVWPDDLIVLVKGAGTLCLDVSNPGWNSARGYLFDEGSTTLYFPVVQECAKGVTRWIEVPEAGKSSHDYRAPAPALKLRAK